MILVAAALASALALGVLALDVGRILLARSQLQNAADLAALAGVAGLRAAGPSAAVSEAVAAAAANVALAPGRLAPVTLAPADVAFPASSAVRVTVRRDRAAGDAIPTFFTQVVGGSPDRRVDLAMSAEAEVLDLCRTTCVRPWGLCDRFDDADGDGDYDAGEVYDPLGTGYELPADVGVQLTIRARQGFEPPGPDAFYNLLEPPLESGQGPPLGGGAVYESLIMDCPPYEVGVGDSLLVEQGHMNGNLKRGVGALIAADPGAAWDAARRRVEGSPFAVSPRLVRVALVDPTFDPALHAGAVRVARLGAFFLESVSANGSLVVRLVDLPADGGVPCAPGETAFVHRRRLKGAS
jgi:hypothetical protein